MNKQKQQAMKWEEMEKEHRRQWEAFEESKLAAWEKVEKDRQAMYAAFGDKEDNMPSTVFERTQRDRDDWEAAYGSRGYKRKYLHAVQKTDRDKLISQTRKQLSEKFKQARKNNQSKSKDRGDDD